MDNIFSKLTDKTLDTTSGILIKRFSNHQPHLTFLNSIFPEEQQTNYIKINTQNPQVIQMFNDEIKRAKLAENINSVADPNRNYNIIHIIQLNSLALSPLIYVSSLIDTLDIVIKEVDNIITDFLWKGKLHNIAKEWEIALNSQTFNQK